MVSDMKYVVNPFMGQGLFTVKYTPQKRHMTPWRFNGINKTNLKVFTVQPNLKWERDPGFRSDAIVSPLT